MAVKHLSSGSFPTLENPGMRSEQIVWPRNLPDARVTITRVTMQPGAVSQRHSHPNSEQTWLVEQGRATLLLAADQTRGLQAGDVIYTPAGDIHGVANTSPEPFVYLAVTTPPQDFTDVYAASNGPG